MGPTTHVTLNDAGDVNFATWAMPAGWGGCFFFFFWGGEVINTCFFLGGGRLVDNSCNLLWYFSRVLELSCFQGV